ncbi:MAG: CotH kinase family protein [Ruminococcus sp.]|nr:CotH kinase family protein [Ruminococcus sp.]
MTKAVSIILTLALVMGICLSGCQTKTSESRATADSATADMAEKTSAAYAESLFDTGYVHEINVEIFEDDWKDLLENPLEKTKYKANVTIDGNRVENVSFATKGNTSLSQVASSDSDRYSFKINFGKYDKGQTYQGLDKLNLNNIMSDATYMKDYLSYMIMREAGVSAPLTSYAALSINGELHGLYIAIENVSDSFLERNGQSADGALYKPESDMMNNAGKGEAPQDDMQPPTNEDSSVEMPQNGMQPPQGNGQPPQGDMQPPTNEDGSAEMPQGGMQPPHGNGQPPQGDMQPPTNEDGGVEMPQGDMQPPQGGDTKGSDLVYTDDNRDSYSFIFDNEENDVSEDDEQQLIAAIKALNSGENIEQYWDMDEVIRYFAAHNFVLNYDSYTGTMLHNYYLYENDGKVSVYPWDYNLAFGGFQGGTDATSAVNWAIDSPLSGATEENRPLWNAVVSNEEYLEKYHQVYSELLRNFFENGKCTEEIERVYNMIRPYVEKDPTAFYTLDRFDTAVNTLKAFCEKRAESISKQLNGTLGSTGDTQKNEDKVDASDLKLTDMGSQGGEKGGKGAPNGMPNNSEQQSKPSE